MLNWLKWKLTWPADDEGMDSHALSKIIFPNLNIFCLVRNNSHGSERNCPPGPEVGQPADWRRRRQLSPSGHLGLRLLLGRSEPALPHLGDGQARFWSRLNLAGIFLPWLSPSAVSCGWLRGGRSGKCTKLHFTGIFLCNFSQHIQKFGWDFELDHFFKPVRPFSSWVSPFLGSN